MSKIILSRVGKDVLVANGFTDHGRVCSLRLKYEGNEDCCSYIDVDVHFNADHAFGQVLLSFFSDNGCDINISLGAFAELFGKFFRLASNESLKLAYEKQLLLITEILSALDKKTVLSQSETLRRSHYSYVFNHVSLLIAKLHDND